MKTIVTGIISIALFFLLLIFVVMPLWNFLFPATIEESTEINFRRLADEINSLDVGKTTTKYDFFTSHPFYIKNNFILAGFNKGKDVKSIDMCEKGKATKPISSDGCDLDSACLCIYTGTAVGDSSPDDCIALNGVDYIFTMRYYDFDSEEIYYSMPAHIYKNLLGGKFSPVPPKPQYPSLYSYLFIYGECDYWWSDYTWGSTKLYVEKMKIDDKVYVMFAIPGAHTKGRRDKYWKPKPKLEKLKEDLLEIKEVI